MGLGHMAVHMRPHLPLLMALLLVNALAGCRMRPWLQQQVRGGIANESPARGTSNQSGAPTQQQQTATPCPQQDLGQALRPDGSLRLTGRSTVVLGPGPYEFSRI